MTTIQDQPKKDIHPGVAMIVLGAMAGGILFGKFGTTGLFSVNEWLVANNFTLTVSAVALVINVAFFGNLMWRLCRKPKQGEKLRALAKVEKVETPPPVKAVVLALSAALFEAVIDAKIGNRSLAWVSDLPLGMNTDWVRDVLAGNLTVAVFAASYYVLSIKWSLPFKWPRGAGFPPLPAYPNEVVLGADETNPRRPTWVPMNLQALKGNVLITGGIGSGKTQGLILPLLDQIFANFDPRPAVLAIDPKRMFVRRAVKIAEQHGLTEQCLHIKFGGKVRYNPIYHPDILRGSRAIDIAQMLRAAAINSMGRSSDGFWETSSFNLVKNALVYCAAVFGYYTLTDLYKTVVRAGKDKLATDLSLALERGSFDSEQRFNIEQTLTYFESEFGAFEPKLKTGILATSTSFLNQFQDFQAAKVFCPAKGEITLTSMDDAVDQGKIILFDIESPALAKALGTILKLQFQQSLLGRLASSTREAKRCGVLLIDEYQDVVTSGHGVALGDDRFLAMSREANAITIVATQSLTSIKASLKSENAALELFQNFRTRITGSTDDQATIRAFQEIIGQKETEKVSRSVSEMSQDARQHVMTGDLTAGRATNVSEGITTTTQKEYVVKAEEFAELEAFQTIARVYDGTRGRFKRISLKPYFVADKARSHAEIFKAVKSAAGAVVVLLLALGASCGPAIATPMPNVCSVVSSPAFDACSEVEVSSCTCPGYPPRPCALISYYRPETFIEVMPNAGQSYFAGLAPVAGQLAALAPTAAVPYGESSERDNHAFQAHVLDVPLAGLIGNFLPCGGGSERPCLAAMSEQLGALWTTGAADLEQPSFLAFAASPAACLAAGTAQSALGGGADPVASPGTSSCSLLPRLGLFPPSSHAECTGWGPFFPRTGVYEGPSQTVAALMVAARLKSLGSEVFQTVARSPDEKWEMIKPGPSACFREGQSAGLLEPVLGVTDAGRLGGMPDTGYLFTIWRRVSCCRDFPAAAALQGEMAALKASCAGGATP